jgi:hypothetical protein
MWTPERIIATRSRRVGSLASNIDSRRAVTADGAIREKDGDRDRQERNQPEVLEQEQRRRHRRRRRPWRCA